MIRNKLIVTIASFSLFASLSVVLATEANGQVTVVQPSRGGCDLDAHSLLTEDIYSKAQKNNISYSQFLENEYAYQNDINYLFSQDYAFDQQISISDKQYYSYLLDASNNVIGIDRAKSVQTLRTQRDSGSNSWNAAAGASFVVKLVPVGGNLSGGQSRSWDNLSSEQQAQAERFIFQKQEENTQVREKREREIQQRSSTSSQMNLRSTFSDNSARVEETSTGYKYADRSQTQELSSKKWQVVAGQNCQDFNRNQTEQMKACIAGGGDFTDGVCKLADGPSVLKKAIEACERKGGTWDQRFKDCDEPDTSLDIPKGVLDIFKKGIESQQSSH